MHRALAICVLLTSATAPALALATVTSAPVTPANAPAPSSKIPPGYTYSVATGSFYKFHNESALSWSDANTTCTSEGAYLLVLNNAEEAKVIKDIVMHAVADFLIYYHGTWTGLRDHRPGGVMDWRTVHGEPLSEVFHGWVDDAPEDDEEFTCAFFSTLSSPYYGLQDFPCRTKHYFTCERSQ